MLIFSLSYSCIVHTEPVLVSVDDNNGNYSHNWIKSINVKNDGVKGKNKVCGLTFRVVLPGHFVLCEMWLTNSADELKYLWVVILSVWRRYLEMHRAVANTCQTDSRLNLPLELKSPIHHVKSINLTICFVLAGLQCFSSLNMILTYVTVTKAHKKTPEQTVLNKSVLCFCTARK